MRRGLGLERISAAPRESTELHNLRPACLGGWRREVLARRASEHATTPQRRGIVSPDGPGSPARPWGVDQSDRSAFGRASLAWRLVGVDREFLVWAPSRGPACFYSVQGTVGSMVRCTEIGFYCHAVAAPPSTNALSRAGPQRGCSEGAFDQGRKSSEKRREGDPLGWVPCES